MIKRDIERRMLLRIAIDYAGFALGLILCEILDLILA
jgi:hypothetical protein